MVNKDLLRPPRNILLVDDSFDVRAMIKEILRSQKIENVDEAADQEVALDKIRQFQYKLVFLDIDLPDGSGLIILQQIKQRSPNTKVVMISGHNTAQNVRTAVLQGADGFVVKPFSPQKILSQTTKWVKAEVKTEE